MGFIVSTIGRKPALIISFFMSSISCISLGLVPNYYALLVGYILSGFGFAGNGNIYLYTNESGDTKFRTASVTIISSGWCIVSMFFLGLSYYMLEIQDWNWRSIIFALGGA